MPISIAKTRKMLPRYVVRLFDAQDMGTVYSERPMVNSRQKHLARKQGVFVLSTLCWRRAALAFRLPSPLEGLTAVFGMRTSVPPPIKHQHKIGTASCRERG